MKVPNVGTDTNMSKADTALEIMYFVNAYSLKSAETALVCLFFIHRNFKKNQGISTQLLPSSCSKVIGYR